MVKLNDGSQITYEKCLIATGTYFGSWLSSLTWLILTFWHSLWKALLCNLRKMESRSAQVDVFPWCTAQLRPGVLGCLLLSIIHTIPSGTGMKKLPLSTSARLALCPGSNSVCGFIATLHQKPGEEGQVFGAAV